MNMYAGCLYLLFFALAGGTTAYGALPGNAVRVEISVPRANISIGDSVTIECAVTIPRGVRSDAPFLKEPDPLLDMENRSVREDTTANGIIRRYSFLAYIVSPDTSKIGPFSVRYSTPAGDSSEALSNVLFLPVAGFVEKPDSPPKESRAPLGIASKGLPGWLIPLLGILTAGFAGWLLLKKLRKKPALPSVSAQPIDELAEFERIRKLRLGETGQVKELYALVSGAIRGFMHRNMGFEALYSTTEEIKKKLAILSGDRKVNDSFREIFDESDMVKFAKYMPPENLSSTVIDRATIPVKEVIDTIARERERIAEEERKRASTSAGSAGTGNPSVPVPPAGGER